MGFESQFWLQLGGGLKQAKGTLLNLVFPLEK